MTLGAILLIILVLMLVGAIPSWPHSRGWGYGPSGGLGVLLLIVVVLLVLGKREKRPSASPQRALHAAEFACPAGLAPRATGAAREKRHAPDRRDRVRNCVGGVLVAASRLCQTSLHGVAASDGYAVGTLHRSRTARASGPVRIPSAHQEHQRADEPRCVGGPCPALDRPAVLHFPERRDRTTVGPAPAGSGGSRRARAHPA